MYLYYFYIALIYPFIEKITKRFSRILIFLGVFPLFIVLATQDAIGTDYYSYIRIFYNKVQFLYSRGIIFKLIVIKLREITSNYRYLFIATSLIQTVTFSYILLKLYRNKYIKSISLFLFLSLSVTNFYLSLFNVLRSSIASLFFFLSVLFILKKEKIKGVILFSFSIGFHPVSILWGLVYFFIKGLKKRVHYSIIEIWIFCVYILNKMEFIPRVSKLLYKTFLNMPYRHYLISEHMRSYTKTLGLSTIIDIFLFSLSLYFYKKENKKEKIFILNIGYVSFILRILFANIPIFNRILDPSKLFQTYIIYFLICNTLKKKYMYIGAIIYMYYIIVFIRSSFLMLKGN